MKIKQFALFGQPVELSPSPLIHKFFANSLGDAIDYEKIEVSPENFDSMVINFFKKGGSGLNITVPHKQAAFQLASSTTPAAVAAKAVNTLWISQGVIHGDNTDGVGFIRDCSNKQITIKQKKILILGAGGAVRGILAPLMEQHPASIRIANRSEEKAKSLVGELGKDNILTSCSLDNICHTEFDIVINGLSLDTFPTGLEFNLSNEATYYDLKYGRAAQSCINWAAKRDFHLISDGWGMLIRQAAESYRIWQQQSPDPEPLITNPLLVTS